MMNIVNQLVVRSIPAFLLLNGLSSGSNGQTDSLRAASKDRWNAPFIKVKKNAPNILWICTDQQRWNTIGALGNPYVKTPNLDRLVREGVSFTSAFCQSPVCTPSRASFSTGMYPSSIQATKNGAAEWSEAAPLVTKLLKDAGYECGLSGKLHLSTAMANRPEKRPKDDGYTSFYYSHGPYQNNSGNEYVNHFKEKGIDVVAYKNELGYVPAEYHQTAWCTDRAIDFIKTRREWPWMFSLNIYDPHGPFDPPQKYIDRYEIDKLPVFIGSPSPEKADVPAFVSMESGNPVFTDSDIAEKSVLNDIMFQSRPKKYGDREIKQILIKYWAQIDLIDENIGRILTALEESGQLDNTLIIFTSDHGEMAGDHGLVQKGCRFYEGLVRVPLIFWYPALFKQDLQSHALVELVDIVPTIYDLVGLPVGDKLQGLSLLSILTGEKPANFHKKSVRCEFYDALMPVGNQKASYGTMYRTSEYKLINYHGHGKGELFDLTKDPFEFHNLWDNPNYMTIKYDLMQKSFDETVRLVDTGPERVGRY